MEVDKKFLYSGISITINAKKAFMKECLKYEVVRKHVAELLKREEIQKRFHVSNNYLGRANLKAVEVTEENLDILFDEIIGKKMDSTVFDKMDHSTREMLKLYSSMFSINGEKKFLDVTNYLTYAVVKTEKCMKQLYFEIKSADLYTDILNEFDKSEYRNQCFEETIEAKEIVASRLFRGLLVKFRLEKSEKLYHMIMRILYAGYKKVKKELARIRKVNGDIIKSIQHNTVANKDNTALLIAGEQIVLYIIADDLNINIEWDFSLLTMVNCIIGIGWEFTSAKEAEREVTLEEKKDILEKVISKYGETSSLSRLLYGSQEDKVYYLVCVMLAFYVNPRKFKEYALNDEEISTLISCKEKWNTKDYMYCMAIAVLCKYIYSLEKILSDVDLHELDIKNEQIEELKKIIMQQENKIENEHIRIKEKEVCANRALLEQEREKENLCKQIEEQKQSISKYEQELTELRNYVYILREKSNEEFEKKQIIFPDFWTNKKVIVLGGHNNWQRKLKEKFPQWQFLTVDKKTFSSEIIRDKDFIVCNTEILSHTAYYKMLASRSKHQHILFVHSNNIELCIQELNAQYQNQYGKIKRG